jgi:hypothetical protein
LICNVTELLAFICSAFAVEGNNNNNNIIIIMALQPFVERWPLFQFLDRIQSRQDSLDGGSAHRKATIYTKNNTENK